MKRIFTFLAALAIVLTGCQKNETFDNGANPANGVIKFGVITPKTRSLPFGGTADFLTEAQTFNIVGRFADGTYYLGSAGSATEVTYSKATNEWSYNGVKFWPDTNLDFFAWKDGKTGTATPTFSNAGDSNAMSFNDYTVSNNVALQQDLLVSADTYGKPTLTGQTVLTFKHALTQVVFSAQLHTDNNNPTPSINVAIDAIELVNVASTGNLTVTPFNYVAGSVGDNNTSSDRTVESKIAWTNPSIISSFAVTPAAPITVATTLTSLTNNTENAMLMIPQRFAAWDYSKSINTGGAYIRVKALIKDGNVVLWGTKNADLSYSSKDLYIPVSSQQGMYGEWVWGRKVNYVIVFGDPNSGSGGGGWGGDGNDPVLVPIRLEAQLTDWDTYDVYLQTTNFSGVAANLQGLVGQFITEINNNPAKKYTANFTVTSGDASALTINWAAATAGKCTVGSKITIDLTAATSKPSADDTFKPTIVLAGHSWVLTKTDDTYVYILTKN